MVYSKSSGYSNAAIGKLETPIKMLIEHESDLMKKKGGSCEWLFNIEKSNRFGETIVAQNDFDIFKYASEGAAAETDSVYETYKKFIEHVQFMKEFVITAEMMEDASYGLAADAKRRIQNFARSYYKTRNMLCEKALVNGPLESFLFGGARIDTTSYDGVPLFHYDHKWGNSASGKSGNQVNYFWGEDVFSVKDGDTKTYSLSQTEKTIYTLASKIRNMKDENGDPIGYTADTIILPGNRPTLESMVKRICGSENMAGTNDNDINLHYGNWTIIVLPSWQISYDAMMVMSSEANKNLGGNMFFERVPLTVSNWVDHHTGNYIWNGRCRFGVGFGTYKHIILARESTSEVVNADYLTF